MNLAVWLKKNGFRADQVQTFYPSPMATATAMYHTGLNTAQNRAPGRTRREGGRGAWRKAPPPAQGLPALPRPANWPLLREALKTMGRADLIGNGKQHLIPTFQPLTDGGYQSARKKNGQSASNDLCWHATRQSTWRGIGLEGQTTRAWPDTDAAHRPAPTQPQSQTRQAQRRSHHTQNVLIKPAWACQFKGVLYVCLTCASSFSAGVGRG
jgi:hypothetical protein